MTSQRLLILLAAFALLTTMLACAYWYQTGVPPDSWLIRCAAGAYVAALVVALVGAETRPRIMLRFLSALFALIAVLALASDLARSSGTDTFSSASLSQALASFAPSVLGSLKNAAGRIAPEAWDSYFSIAFNAPAFLVFGALALFCGFAGRRRHLVDVFVN